MHAKLLKSIRFSLSYFVRGAEPPEVAGQEEVADRGPEYRPAKIPCAGLGLKIPQMPLGGTQAVNFATVPNPDEPFASGQIPGPTAPPASEIQEDARERREQPPIAEPPKQQAAPATSPETTARTPRTSQQHERTGIGSEFFRMSAHDKFSILKDYVDCLMYQFKSLTDVIPPDQLASKVKSATLPF